MLEKQIEYIKSVTDLVPEVAVVLGSGLGDFADEVENKIIINYNDIPDFPVSTAPTHKGRFVLGNISGKKVIIMQGRLHLYEGYSPQKAVMPIRIARLLGADKLLLTNAAGGVNRTFSVGDLMIIDDHISSFVPSPLIGKNDDALGTRFPDMSEAYSKRLRDIIRQTAAENNTAIKSGTYLQFTGPQFETPAEIRMAEAIGADAVGMSTAIETIAAVHCGFEVAGISVISNLASGISDKPITSEEVSEAADEIAPIFKNLIKKSIGKF